MWKEILRMIFTPLLPHQVEALDYLKEHDPCLLAMFLGSGKSLVALAYAEHIGAKRILITSDKNNVINTWPEEIYRHTDYDVIIRPDKKKLDAIPHPPDKPVCVVANYDLIGHHPYDYCKQWDLWIGDESSEFKDQRTLKHKGIRLVSRGVPHRVILNGTLMTERLEDVYGQIALISNGQIPDTLTRFRQRYMQPDTHTGFGWLPKRSAFTHFQRDIKDISYWLKKSKSVKIPERNYHVVECDMTPEQKEVDGELKTMFASYFDGDEIETNFASVAFIKRIQTMGGVYRMEDETWKPIPSPKLDVLGRIIEDNPDSKIVVWHTYIPETQIIREYLEAQDIPMAVVDSPKATDQLNLFADNQGPQVCLIRTSLCKGLNSLVGGDIAVFYSNPLSFARRAQAEGRTCRITSDFEDTHYFDIITKGGADEMVYHMLSQKKSMSLTMATLRGILSGELTS